jgi:hypothetical protein
MLGRKRRKGTTIILLKNVDVRIGTGKRRYQRVNQGGSGEIHANWLNRGRVVIRHLEGGRGRLEK